METTRHFTATCYVVHDGATALHEHGRLGLVLPPGGHVDRDELPHETALRETREETGLDPTLLPTGEPPLESATARALPRPRRLMLHDINVHDGAVGHQHIDHVYFATVPGRDIDPDDGEEGPDAWEWYTRAELRGSDIDSDIVELGTAAIEAAESA